MACVSSMLMELAVVVPPPTAVESATMRDLQHMLPEGGVPDVEATDR